MFQWVYCVGGSLKNLCHFEMGGSGKCWRHQGGGGRSMLTVADSCWQGGGGDKICQNLADVICERSHIVSCARITLHPFQSEPECIIKYNTVAVSCPRVPSSKLSGIIALSTLQRRYYSITRRYPLQCSDTPIIFWYIGIRKFTSLPVTTQKAE